MIKLTDIMSTAASAEPGVHTGLSTPDVTIVAIARAEKARLVLAAIVDAYDDNALDGEGRKIWGSTYQFVNQTPPDKIELFNGRGGKCFLTLQDCMDARGPVSAPTPPVELSDGLTEAQMNHARFMGGIGDEEWD